MIPTSLLDLDVWAALGPPLANHLWQSTLFAAVAGLLTLLLRRNHARARHWLWLAASVKFLVPFSLLIGIGGQLAWTTAPVIPSHGFSVLVEPVGPHLSPTRPDFTSTAAAPTALPAAVGFLPALLVGVWFCGSAAVVLSWCVRWRRVRAAMRGGVPLREGREPQALRRVERISGIRRPIELVSSRAPVEPGVVGILRPVLLWPAGISDRLADAQIEAIIVHELCHVRRRDNLTSAVHMVVETLFWFHPLVWWLGARLVDERERACDEEVLRLGSEPEVYAESIIRTCEFYLRSPLVCVAGVTGSDLKKRVERIMVHRIAHGLTLGRKMLLAAAGIATVALPILIGIVNAPQSRAQSQAGAGASQTPGAPLTFEVASVKPVEPSRDGRVSVSMGSDPGRVNYRNVTLTDVLQRAYRVRRHQITGPSWLDNDRFDIVAKIPEGVSSDQVPVMLQNLLIERFKLTLRSEKKEMPVYVLLVGKNGPKLEKVADDGEPGPGQRHGVTINNGQLPRLVRIEGNHTTLSNFANMLSNVLDRPVIDQTELPGTYNFVFETALGDAFMKRKGAMVGMGPEEKRGAGGEGGPAPDSTPSGSLFSDIQKLGLKLEPRKMPLDFIIIEKGNRIPMEN